jgi:hypothetical protein
MEKDPEIIIDFCEFLMNEINNIYLIFKYVNIVEKYHLSIFQKIKLNNLRQLVQL